MTVNECCIKLLITSSKLQEIGNIFMASNAKQEVTRYGELAVILLLGGNSDQIINIISFLQNLAAKAFHSLPVCGHEYAKIPTCVNILMILNILYDLDLIVIR